MADPKGRKWCFTINNWNEEIYDTVLDFCLKSKQYICAKEIAPTTGTPHLQGYVEFKNAKRFSTVKRCLGGDMASVRKARGTALDNKVYCSKEWDFVTNIGVDGFQEKLRKDALASYKDVVWHDWQQQVLDILGNPPDNRKVYWFWEPAGGAGKSFLCKYIACKYHTIIASGKSADIFNQLRTMIKDEHKVPHVVFLDIPRTSFGYLNYACLEQLKNGLVYSGKYEGGQLIFPQPHVICFANQEPDMYAMSEDRWYVHKIESSAPPPPGKPGDDEAPPEGDGAADADLCDKNLGAGEGDRVHKGDVVVNSHLTVDSSCAS